ncbi:unnamed protein product [Pleuronectes platessa]|uniref:Uncharacterized protein n=1 Tax=Pleuronectes platessa TaxID=8262 RepID=A0A9N7Y4Z6_PLEPL|nr:unnamed protein product [Pleuronectes platessa]
MAQVPCEREPAESSSDSEDFPPVHRCLSSHSMTPAQVHLQGISLAVTSHLVTTWLAHMFPWRVSSSSVTCVARNPRSQPGNQRATIRDALTQQRKWLFSRASPFRASVSRINRNTLTAEPRRKEKQSALVLTSFTFSHSLRQAGAAEQFDSRCPTADSADCTSLSTPRPPGQETSPVPRPPGLTERLPGMFTPQEPLASRSCHRCLLPPLPMSPASVWTS